MTWTLTQLAVRNDWGLAELDADPRNHSLIEPGELAWRAKVARGEIAYTGPSRVRLPSLLPDAPEPLTNEEIAAHTAEFVAAFPYERALLAVADPDGEADAINPLSAVRARQVLLERAEADRVSKVRRMAHLTIVPAAGFDDRDLLTRLGADPSRGRGVIRCPAHDDRGPSLSWRLTDDGRALLHCFAGCDFRAILAAAS